MFGVWLKSRTELYINFKMSNPNKATIEVVGGNSRCSKCGLSHIYRCDYCLKIFKHGDKIYCDDMFVHHLCKNCVTRK